MKGNSTPLTREFTKGLWNNNPVLVQLLGMCPTLAVTTTALNGLSMGLATTFVLVCSGFVVSSIKRIIPHEVRIATYTAIIATFVTIAKISLDAFFPLISARLGPYVPLIVVNCIILGRQEAFASKNSVGRTLFDTFGMGVGFALTLMVLGSVREIFGSGFIGTGTGLETQLLSPKWFEPMVVMILPAGAFITLGLLVGLFRWINLSRNKD